MVGHHQPLNLLTGRAGPSGVPEHPRDTAPDRDSRIVFTTPAADLHSAAMSDIPEQLYRTLIHQVDHKLDILQPASSSGDKIKASRPINRRPTINNDNADK